jgi:hypothetical protein
MWVPGRWDTVDGGWQWVPGFWAAAQEKQHEVSYLPQPPAPLEAAASVPAPSPDHVYVAGYWVYRDDHYVWHPGYWYLPRPDWIWVPAHYTWTPAGYVFVEGYWDHALRNRGIMYAPVYIDVAVARRPGWYYTPRLVIGCDAMCGALFVRPGCSVYYFGDYYEPGYRTTYVAYCDYHPYGCYDPIYCGARYEHRADPQWSVSISLSFGNRYSGVDPRPARTFVYNQTVINKTVINETVINKTTVNNTNVNNVSMVSTMKQVSASQGMAMKPVPMAERQEHQAAAKEMHAAAKQRSAMEAQAKAQGPPKAGQPARSVKMDVPKSQGAAVAKANVAAKTEAAKTGTPPAAHTAPQTKTPGAANTPAKTDPKAAPTTQKTETKAPTPGTHPDAKPPLPGAHTDTTKPPLPGTPTKPGAPPSANHNPPPQNKPPQGKGDTKSDAKSKDKEKEKDKEKGNRN